MIKIQNRIHGVPNLPKLSQNENGRTVEKCTPAFLDDLITVTRNSKQDYGNKLLKILSKLEKAGYRENKRKSAFS